MGKIKQNVIRKDLIALVVILILTVISLIVYLKASSKYNDEVLNEQVHQTKTKEPETETYYIPQTNDEIIKYLSGLGEGERMEYYCAEYFKCLEDGDYDGAYNLLYTEFKKNYFPTVEEFEKYVKKTYPEYWALQYDDITRQGDLYVLRLKILDVLGSRDNEKVQRIVIKENTYNDFVVSFQVI